MSPTPPPTAASPTSSGPLGAHAPVPAESHGLRKGLRSRHMQMIALGSAIGTGLFLGAGGRLAEAGPSLVFLYLICGGVTYLILRSLGELMVHRPTSGSFVSYAREFFGERVAFVAGWMYWLMWALVMTAEATAVAIYVAWFSRYEALAFLGGVPQWVTAFVVVALVLALNLISVKVFGELEFWLSLVKIVALVVFLAVAAWVVLTGSPSGAPTGFSLISDHGGWFPHGVLPAVVVMQGVLFAYVGVELIGTAAGETEDVERIIPRSINTVILRVLLFYCGSVLLLVLALPYTAYSATESPFVTFFSSIGVGFAGPLMQLVVITAAISSMNAGLYSTGRIVRSMSLAGSGPRFAARVNAAGVPTGGILLTAAVGVVGVVVNLLVPEQAFEVMINLVCVGALVAWSTIAATHIRFVRRARQGLVTRPSYRAPGGIAGDVLVLAFLAFVLVLIGLSYPVGTYSLLLLVVVGPALWLGWRRVRGRVAELAAARGEGVHDVEG